MQVQQMISMHPDVRGSTNDALIRCIEECYSCAQTCTSCADACLAEEMVKELTQCVRLNLDCADVCNITGRIATRRTGSDDELIRRCSSPARRRVACAAMNASGTRAGTNTAAYARKRAASACKRAKRWAAVWLTRA